MSGSLGPSSFVWDQLSSNLESGSRFYPFQIALLLAIAARSTILLAVRLSHSHQSERISNTRFIQTDEGEIATSNLFDQWEPLQAQPHLRPSLVCAMLCSFGTFASLKA